MKNGFDVESNTGIVNVKANIQSNMVDLTQAHLYLGVGGAYCDLCSLSKCSIIA